MVNIEVLETLAHIVNKDVLDGKVIIHSRSDIRAAIKNNEVILLLDLVDDDKDRLEQILGGIVLVQGGERGSEISKDVIPWLAERKLQEGYKNDYWDRFAEYMRNQDGFTGSVINRLNEDTERILDFCGDPLQKGDWKRSGLVMGHVQSGKTTNYSGVMVKAQDAGYKIFILFAGITNSLRSQTQERIEEAVVGLSTRNSRPTGVGLIRNLQRPTMWTTLDKDFNLNSANATRGNLNDGTSHIFVLKKNLHTIKNLLKWLEKSLGGTQLKAPLLLIDDEADNASINTAKNKQTMTAINAGIRKVLQRFNKATYVAYTATPFANIFIDFENDEELMEREAVEGDLFPRNFIKSLGAPTNYVGSERMFGDNSAENSLHQAVVDVEDYENIIPLKHKKYDPIPELPPSLLHAIRMFILCCSIRKIRGYWKKHNTMMVNVSRFNDVQTRVEDLITDYLTELKNSAVAGAGTGSRALLDPNIAAFNDSYLNGSENLSGSEYEMGYAQLGECENIDFVVHILPILEDVIEAILPKTINMKTSKASPLDYNSSPGQKLIVIGGLALSRGLTLEGLSINYILRNASASDTLMQMARWFGYRKGWENLMRLYLPPMSREHYESVHTSIEELRGELAIMQIQRKTPLEFGLKVRNSPTGIRITAANKSRSASSIEFTRTYEDKHIQGFLLSSSEEVRKYNFDLTTSFVKSLGAPAKKVEAKSSHAMWSTAGSEVLKFLKVFNFPDEHPDLGCALSNNSLLYEYIQERVSDELKDWGVIIILNGTAKTDEINIENIERSFYPSERHSCSEFRNSKKIFKTTSKNALANPNDIKLGLGETERQRLDEEIQGAHRGVKNRLISRARGKPLLLIHLIHCKPKKEDINTGIAEGGQLHASLGFLLTETHKVSHPKSYTANRVYQLFGDGSEFSEVETDDDYDAIISEGA